MRKDKIIEEIIKTGKILYNNYNAYEQILNAGADISKEREQFYKGKAECTIEYMKLVGRLLEKIREI